MDASGPSWMVRARRLGQAKDLGSPDWGGVSGDVQIRFMNLTLSALTMGWISTAAAIRPGVRMLLVTTQGNRGALPTEPLGRPEWCVRTWRNWIRLGPPLMKFSNFVWKCWQRCRSDQNRKTKYPKIDRVWAPMLGSIFDMFRYFSMFFCVLFLVSVLMVTRTDFSWILISLLDHF